MEDNSKWEAGDIAICVNNGRLSGNTADGHLPALRKDYEYIVHNVKTCECGCVDLDIGLCSPNNVGTRCGCGAVSSPKSGIHWAASIRFVKKRTRAEVESELEEAINNEEFKYAQNLQEELDTMKL